MRPTTSGVFPEGPEKNFRIRDGVTGSPVQRQPTALSQMPLVGPDGRHYVKPESSAVRIATEAELARAHPSAKSFAAVLPEPKYSGCAAFSNETASRTWTHQLPGSEWKPPEGRPGPGSLCRRRPK